MAMEHSIIWTKEWRDFRNITSQSISNWFLEIIKINLPEINKISSVRWHKITMIVINERQSFHHSITSDVCMPFSPISWIGIFFENGQKNIYSIRHITLIQHILRLYPHLQHIFFPHAVTIPSLLLLLLFTQLIMRLMSVFSLHHNTNST